MSEKRKNAGSLYAAVEHIERYHRRRSIFVMHAVASIAFQIALWMNWYSSYAMRGLGFRETFFTDRITVSIALALFLAGHFSVMSLLESKDRAVVQAIRRYEAERSAAES